jgi:uncharacterized protein with HEPN domain
MEIEIRKYLYDIQQACQLIHEFTDGQTFEGYQSNPMLKSAVERQFIPRLIREVHQLLGVEG